MCHLCCLQSGKRSRGSWNGRLGSQRLVGGIGTRMRLKALGLGYAETVETGTKQKALDTSREELRSIWRTTKDPRTGRKLGWHSLTCLEFAPELTRKMSMQRWVS